VNNCRVSRSASDGIIIEAQAHNATSQPIAKIFIIVSTSPPAGIVPHDSLYELDGLLPPNTGVTLRTVLSKQQAETFPAASIEAQLAPITQCFIQAVEYPDHSRKIYYTPL
jgi:hypothetical protein